MKKFVHVLVMPINCCVFLMVFAISPQISHAAPMTVPWVFSEPWAQPNAVTYSDCCYADESNLISGTVAVSKWNPNIGTLTAVRINLKSLMGTYNWDTEWSSDNGGFDHIQYSAQISFTRPYTPGPGYALSGSNTVNVSWNNQDSGVEMGVLGVTIQDSENDYTSNLNRFIRTSPSDLLDFTIESVINARAGFGGGTNTYISGGMSGFYTGFLFVRYRVDIDPNAPFINPMTGTPYNGDCNLDGFVGIEDLNQVLGNWGLSTTTEERDIGYNEGDLNLDGYIDIVDMNIVLGNWNAGTPPIIEINVPEPASLALISLGGLAMLRRRQA